MLLQIHLYTTPYYILYKDEKLIYTEKFLLKLFFIPTGSPRQDGILYITGRFYTNRNPILAEKFHLNGKPYTGSKYQTRR